MREPNSTPMVTSWEGLKRPSQRRIVSCGVGVSLVFCERGEGGEEGTYGGFAAARVADVDYFL